MERRNSLWFALGLLLLAWLVPGCQTQTASQRVVVRTLERQFAADFLPANLGVLAVQNESGEEGVPLKDCRRLFQNALMNQGFSPLSEEFVDQQSGGGSLAPEQVRLDGAAVAALSVRRWQGDRAETHGILGMALYLVVYGEDGSRVGTLYLDRRQNLTPGQYSALTPRQRAQKILEDAMNDLVASMPGPPPL
ncbi:MAG: hypothetical protein DWQ01_15365 [Planctomycetota bacterium]|nr:MAG: hypothetical protein DWQ01_15365 [Planctomycetota bacterium]